LPELPELDSLFSPEGVIQQAQELAAAAFEAERTWFLANGSTCGVEAAVLAVCGPGDKILVPRNAHRSVVSALILSGAVPVYLTPSYDPTWDLAHGVDPATVAAALADHADAKAVLIVSPTYHGVCADVAAIATLTHRHGIPLLVDEAHGPHFAFHPDLPTPALAAGADLVVQSAHKVLGALTQSALLHVRGSRLDCDRITQALALTQSTSPSYLLLASLDGARQQMATEGFDLWQQTLAAADEVRSHLADLPGLRLLGARDLPPGQTLDRSRLTVAVNDLGLTGFQADESLHETWQVTAELPTLNHLTFLLGWGNSPADLAQLQAGLGALSRQPGHPRQIAPLLPAVPRSGLTPRQAFFAPRQTCAAAAAVGQLSAELICPYPPGIPWLWPGEEITAESLAGLGQILAAGGIVTGCTDSSLQTVQVSRP
jgi:arginine decarboxylase